MNNLLNKLKESDVEMPIVIGQFLAHIPFSVRPGIAKTYRAQKKLILDFKGFSVKQKEDLIFKKFYTVFEHAYLNVPFYSRLYKDQNLKLKDISSLADIEKIPIVSKKELMAVPLKERSYPVKNRLKVNTGGSSGQPFSFYMDPSRYGNEWAHIHYMWSKLGYQPSSLKLGFDGRSTVKNLINYDFIRNNLRYDIYADPFLVCEKLSSILKHKKVEYLHGYPSAIYEFAKHCKENDAALLEILKKTLKGAFLSSEFPAPHYRNEIEEIFNIQTQAFYGHTETCVMAMETNKYEYEVFQTYGYAEGCNLDNKTTNLVGTSYFNFASPLIRYNTQDSIEVLNSKDGWLETFKIKEGRKSDFILDETGNKISLTGLIFGRHHKLFELCDHIQISQEKPGDATIYYVTNNDQFLGEINELFDSKNIKIEFHFVKIQKPILTQSGKINLLVKP